MTEFYPCGCSIYVHPMRRQSDGFFKEIRVKREEHADACGKHLKSRGSSHGQPGVKGPGRGSSTESMEPAWSTGSRLPNAPTFFEIMSGTVLYPPGHSLEVRADRKIWVRRWKARGNI